MRSQAQCRISIGARPRPIQKLQNADLTGLAWECLRRNPEYRRTLSRSLQIRSTALQPNSGRNGACLFAADPQKACHEQIVFWAPEVLPTVLSVRASSSHTSAQPIALDLTRLSPDELRQNTDGWHAVLRFGGATHRVWMKELPAAGASQAIELPLDSSFELRAQAAQSLWRTLSGRSPVSTAVRPFSAAAPAVCLGLARTGRTQ